MNNLFNLLRKYNGKVARVLCCPGFANSALTSDGIALMNEEYWLELTDGRVVYQDGSVDESPLTQFMRSRGQEAVYRELVTLGLQVNADEHRAEVAARRAEKEIKAVASRMAANLSARSYRKSRT